MSKIVASELKILLTPASNADPLLSLGGVGSDVEVGVAIHSIFDYVNPDEGVAGDVEYRAVDLENTNLVETLYGAVLYISTPTSGVDDSISLAYDSTGTQAIADESTPPIGVTFSEPASKATGIALGDIAPSEKRRIWLRRTVTSGAADGVSAGVLTVTGGTYDSGA